MFSEDPILLPEIVDQIVLVTVHPASEREDEELQRRRHSLRLLGRLDQHRPSLGRFFAPYAVTYETIRQWGLTFGPSYARALRRRRGRLGDTWHLDELFVTLNGRLQYLWRAVDEDGDVLDILVQSRRHRCAAVRFFRKLLKRQARVPRRLITDKLRSDAAAQRKVMPSVVHCTDQYANNRAEVSHQPIRQRERQMRRFKSAAHVERFVSVHGVVQNLFRVGRHLLRAAHHRVLRTRAFVEWDVVTCAC